MDMNGCASYVEMRIKIRNLEHVLLLRPITTDAGVFVLDRTIHTYRRAFCAVVDLSPLPFLGHVNSTDEILLWGFR